MEYRDGIKSKGDKIGMPCAHSTVITQYSSTVYIGMALVYSVIKEITFKFVV